MKFVLNLTFVVIFVAVVAATTSEDETSVKPVLRGKEKIRYNLLRELQRQQRYGIQTICPRELTPEQIVFGEETIEKFVACGNATIDIFLNKLDDDVDFDQIEEHIDKVTGPICEIFDDIFRCVGEISPVIDMCLNEREKIFKNKLFGIVPLIQQTLCLRNGALIAQIIRHNDTDRCMRETVELLIDIGMSELFESNATELFGDVRVCQQFSDVLKQIYINIGECSLGVLEMVKDMVGFFCEGTHCERYLHDLQCY